MWPKQVVKAVGIVAAFGAIVLAGMLSSSRRVQAVDHDNERSESEIRQGFEIAPVHLNLDGKNRELVGLGSYIVNAQSDCNGCHSAGPPTEFAPGGNPYLLNQGPTTINQATYLGGGRDFGGYPMPASPLHIISRNLTPDKTGRPEGGHTFEEFVEIMRTGEDMDHVHPTCMGAPSATCVPFPFDGSRLQIMPWPIYHNMTDHDLRAIYEYLRAIPCIDNTTSTPPAGAPNELRNDCG
jgi:hypothetical protein